MNTVTRFEVQRLHSGDVWRPLWGEGPVRFESQEEADAECARVSDARFRCRVVRLEGLHPVTQLDLDEYVTPLVARFWRLHRPGQPRVGNHDGPTPILAPLIDEKRDFVLTNWAILSGWAPRPILFAPEIPLDRLPMRFPFARPRSLPSALRLLTLHECAHYVHGHNGLLVSLDHLGEKEVLREKFAAMEGEADKLTRLWWEEGMTSESVPVNPRPLCSCSFCAPRPQPEATKKRAPPGRSPKRRRSARPADAASKRRCRTPGAEAAGVASRPKRIARSPRTSAPDLPR